MRISLALILFFTIASTGLGLALLLTDRSAPITTTAASQSDAERLTAAIATLRSSVAAVDALRASLLELEGRSARARDTAAAAKGVAAVLNRKVDDLREALSARDRQQIHTIDVSVAPVVGEAGLPASYRSRLTLRNAQGAVLGTYELLTEAEAVGSISFEASAASSAAGAAGEASHDVDAGGF